MSNCHFNSEVRDVLLVFILEIIRIYPHQCCTGMVSRSSFWRLCSIKSMFYTLLLISLCVGLHVWILDAILDFTDTMRYALSAVTFFTPTSYIDANTKIILSWQDQYLTKNLTGSFPTFNCSDNCIFTADRDMLHNLGEYDAIIFGHNSLKSNQRPEERTPTQIYVFMSIESSYKYPACELYNDDYFNLTFTYRFDSDVLWKYFVVRNASGEIVAPSREVVWTKSESPLKPNIKSILQRKRKAVVWLADDCCAESLEYMARLEKHLYHFGLKLDKARHCAKGSVCNDILVQNYQFFLAFENSVVKDYVSEKVMDGFRNYAVPVVYGGANYSRFLPPGSYIDAFKMHPYTLAHTISQVSVNQSLVENFFKWTNVYRIEDWGTKTHSSLCELCTALQGHGARNFPTKKHFRAWWNSPHSMHRCLPIDHLEKDHVNHSVNFIII